MSTKPTPPSVQLPFVAKWCVSFTGHTWSSEVWATGISEEYNGGWRLYLWLLNVPVAFFPRADVKGAWVIAGEGKNHERIEQALHELPGEFRLLG